MGWQSYVLGFNTPEEKERIINAIKKHNSPKTDDEINNVGEELVMIQETTFTKPFITGELADYKKAILCGNGGGRWTTFEFFETNNLPVERFTSSINKRFSTERIEIEIE